MLLTGTFCRVLDDKGRFAIPKLIRDHLALPENANLYMAPGTDGSLALYTAQIFHQVGERLGNASPTAQGVRAFSRLFYAQAQPVSMDRQSRIRIPIELADLAKLDKEIVLVGVRDHLEIWDKQRWEAYLARTQPDYDQIAEMAFGAPPEAPTEPSVQPRPAQPR